jgi:hypothetical protein
MMQSPRVFLALDNCFAIKRWVRPRDWMQVGRELGFTYMEASADNEIDALYSDERYMAKWAEEAKAAQAETGVRLANFYSGYQTYRTVGLAHHDAGMRKRLVDEWLKRMVDLADDLEAGLGFHMFAYTDEVLQDPKKHADTTDLIIDQLQEVAEYARDRVQVSIEQMYSPHQPPWTIAGTIDFLERVYRPSGAPVYTTIDFGHQIGQTRYRRPAKGDLAAAIARAEAGKSTADMWMGPEKAYALLDRIAGQELSDADRHSLAREIEEAAAAFPYLFAEERDGDLYAWIEEVGRYSPIMHLQQTDGVHSGHRAFTPETNKDGIVRPDEVLAALARSFAQPAEEGMPPPVEDIYLTFEVFAGTAETNRQVIEKLTQSCEYWREYVPRDGMLLSELVATPGDPAT